MPAHDDHYLRRELYALIQSDPRIFDFLEAGSLDGVWYWDIQNPEHEWMSDRFWHTFGKDPHAMPPLASAWQDMIHPDDLQVAFRNAQAHFADADVPYDQEVRYTHEDGHTVWVRCRGIAIRDDEGNAIRMLGAHQDITALKRAEEELTQTVDELAKANEELQRFAYAASHDIRSPANTLKSMLARLSAGHAESLNAEGRQLLDFALKSAARLEAMSRHVLDYSKVSRAEVELTPVTVAVKISNVVADMQHSISVEGASVQSDIPSDLVVQADPTMLRLLIQNLLENALKYRAESAPEVRIEAERHGNRWQLRVHDNGIGIPAERREQVFEAFERLHLRSKYAGVGLGLATVRQIAHAHGGEVHITDSPLGGTCFVLDLPVNPED